MLVYIFTLSYEKQKAKNVSLHLVDLLGTVGLLQVSGEFSLALVKQTTKIYFFVFYSDNKKC